MIGKGEIILSSYLYTVYAIGTDKQNEKSVLFYVSLEKHIFDSTISVNA